MFNWIKRFYSSAEDWPLNDCGVQIDLKLPTDLTVEGPRISADFKNLKLEYDYQADDGSIDWCSITFNDILAYKWRGIANVSASDVMDEREMRFQNESEYLRKMVDNWEILFGHTEFQKKKGGAARFKHYTIYFNDAGSLNVVAAECIVE